MEYFTAEYGQALADALNKDPEFQAKAGSVKATVVNVCKGPAPDQVRSFLMTFDNGKVTSGPATPDTKADFTFIGDYATWVSNHKGDAALEKLVMTGKLKFKGSIPRIMSLKSQLSVVDGVGRRIPVTY